MKIVVTGGAGFIGSHVVDAYLSAGHRVIVVDDLSSGSVANLNPGATFHQLDIRSEEFAELLERERPEVVNHHAAQISVRDSVANPLRDVAINIGGSVALLEACRKAGVRKVVYISSGGAMYGEPERLPCDESHPVRPRSPYGISKHTVEHYLFAYRENFGLSYTVLRYPNVYGPRQDPFGEAGVISIFTEQMLRGEQPVIYGTGEQDRDFLYVGDCASANLLALEGGDGREYNLGMGVGTTVNRLFRLLKAATGYSGEAVHGPPRTGELEHSYLDTTRIRTELGWAPSVSLEEGLDRTVRFFRARLEAGDGGESRGAAE